MRGMYDVGLPYQVESNRSAILSGGLYTSSYIFIKKGVLIMMDPKEMLYDYEVFCRQKLDIFNILIKVDLGLIKREDLVLPVGILEKTYKAMDEYTKCLGLSLNLLGVELPDID